MLPNLFAHPLILLYGVLAGIVFGFLLQKGQVSQFKYIVEQLLLKNFTIFKVILTAIIVGSVGIYGMIALGLPVTLHIKTGSLLAITLGASIMGIGSAILGYCPGTCVAAAGQGSRDAWGGLLGMLLGAAVYAELYVLFEMRIHPINKITSTLPELFDISPWVVIAPLVVVAGIIFLLLEKKRSTQ